VRTKVRRYLRTEKWWNAKPPLMAAIAYWQLGAGRTLKPVGAVLLPLMLFGIATFGLAAFGYLLNDFGDRESDRLSAVPNAVLSAGTRRTVAGLIVLAGLAVLPWFWLPTDGLVITLLGLEVGLFVAYVLPPMRLKVRGIAGIVTDALYGYVIPLVVAMLVFANVADRRISPVSSLFLVSWSCVLGVRQILSHQLIDAGRDERAGISTFALSRGWRSGLHLLWRITLVEAILFPLFLLTLGWAAPVTLCGLAAYTGWVLSSRPAREIRGRLPIRRLGLITRILLLGWDLMSTFHVQWLPLLLAGALTWRDPAYGIVLIGHLLLFRTPFSDPRRLRFMPSWTLSRPAV
jgi:4-hydroxybenzoate polyprenyltransferase